MKASGLPECFSPCKIEAFTTTYIYPFCRKVGRSKSQGIASLGGGGLHDVLSTAPYVTAGILSLDDAAYSSVVIISMFDFDGVSGMCHVPRMDKFQVAMFGALVIESDFENSTYA